MNLSPAQVQRFWREWSSSCKARGWTRTAGLTAAEIAAKRKDLLANCGFESLTQVDRTAGFTRLLHEVIVLRGTSLRSAHETIDPSLNEARVLRAQIAGELIPCLELYVEGVPAYLGAILGSQFGSASSLTDLDASQLRRVQYTLAARVQSKRKTAGDSVHDMRTRAGVPCGCAQCVSNANYAHLSAEDAVSTADRPF